MKRLKHLFLFLLLALPLTSVSAEYLDTQYTTGGLETHLLKASVSNGVLTIAFMVENPTDEKVELTPPFNPNQVEYVAGDKRYPALKDANDQWMLSPFGSTIRGTELFSEKTGTYYYGRFKAEAKIVAGVKFEAPDDDAWPIDLALPQTSPFTIENPNKP